MARKKKRKIKLDFLEHLIAVSDIAYYARRGMYQDRDLCENVEAGVESLIAAIELQISDPDKMILIGKGPSRRRVTDEIRF
jgi:hypothetical protein